MSRKRYLLKALTVAQLRQLAKENNIKLTKKGVFGNSPVTTKDDIITILENNPKITIAKINAFISGESTKKETKKSVSIDYKIPQDVTGKARDRLKGHEFEKVVAKWAKRYFNADGIKINCLRRGYRAKRAYEIDVWAYSHGGLFSDGWDIWIECKNIKGSIKRDTVMKFVSKMKDVNDAVENGQSREGRIFKYGVIVTTSRFDIDALQWANSSNIACFRYENGRFIKENEVDWI